MSLAPGRLRAAALLAPTALFVALALGPPAAQATDCDGFAGPYDPCPASFPPYASIAGSYWYGPGVGPFYDNYFPLIQVCFEPECPPCVFGDLELYVQIYPRDERDFICDVNYYRFPPGTTSVPGLSVPSGECPIVQAITFPDQFVVCPGDKTVEITIETDSELIDQTIPGGGSRAFRSFGYDLLCLKSVEEALAYSRGIIPIVLSPDEGGGGFYPSEWWFPFAAANLSPDPHEVLITMETTADWTVTAPPPASIPLAGGESANVLVGFELPPGLSPGATNVVTVTAELAGVPGSTSTSVTELRLGPGTNAVPALAGPGLIAGAIGLIASGALLLHRRRGRSARGRG